ncbi:MAG: thioredoxin-dependent thiol peroxidase [Chloroflexi bacterium]|nr:thioredoxin-dependent thiol peroxidase [Chloroflexota bacterium]
MPISAGGQAPDFTLPDDEGRTHTLSEYRGKPVVLYFYPKDNTSGCTKEACGFRDDYSAYQDAGVIILGVSPDSSKSHANFRTKYELPFILLADPDREVLKKYGAWGLKKLYGREYEGVLRTTFLISEDGNILKVFEKVKPANHSAEILAALQDLDE